MYIPRAILTHSHQWFSWRVHQKRHVNNIIFLVTNECNARCSHCFLKSALNKDSNQNLTLEEIRKFFSSLGRVDNIVLGGGEPFLRQDLEHICSLLENVSKPATISIPTNGSIPEVICQKTQHILDNSRSDIKISLSLDGPPDVHDRIRGIPGLFANVEKTYDMLVLLRTRYSPRLHLQINATIHRENYPYFRELYSLAHGRFKEAVFMFETIRGDYDAGLVTSISDAMYSDLVDFIVHDERYRATSFFQFHKVALEIIKHKRQYVPCNAGVNFIVLDFFGNLYPCEILPPVANIREVNYSFKKILRSRQWQASIRKIREGQCYCTHMCFLMSSLQDAKK